ncbi:hypothetical protein I7819_18035 [Burkholderia multivorans]|uniref:hypothetical protein n=2 Tax=Burkholderia multivorans TaxID=87883 RepID=UPI0019049CBB|nr:hypothetical protein [Burkholderia multivorans]MBJ9941775.1 hypothetical protein [Burkholderia multivorans]
MLRTAGASSSSVGAERSRRARFLMMVISNRAVLSPESENDADRGQNDRAKNGVSSITRDYRLREMNRNHENADDLNRADFDLFV